MASAREVALRRARERAPALLLALLPREQWQEALADDRRAAAERRAEALLCEYLTDREWDQLVACGYLEVASPSLPTHHYRIPRYGGQIQVYEGECRQENLCVGPVELVPGPDVVLIHLLMLRGNEQAYLATANHFPMQT